MPYYANGFGSFLDDAAAWGSSQYDKAKGEVKQLVKTQTQQTVDAAKKATADRAKAEAKRLADLAAAKIRETGPKIPSSKPHTPGTADDPASGSGQQNDAALHDTPSAGIPWGKYLLPAVAGIVLWKILK